ncbi:TetR/AcrR family transcriptional regulator [Mucilaginibacter pallidiroseus]|uniref:TetR/AcrR family transcriptional regulator n=1 Tax=Mucilaginibacter pallidiroseus TaxID=2599295 RepID=A0A563UBY7_9SPHI|nr:TetR/AcrR family transcriptional regulator [Mucilaginibacter pallidiroseus]TWR28840.1 TetR/AcrR family transcriptional regulator [Mucilaginibacter pallidiroseus]
MEKHNGQIIEYLVRKYGYSITDLAKELNVNRRSVYNYFQNKYLKSEIIFRIGIVIRHDFSNEFPELFGSNEFTFPIGAISATPTPVSSPINEDVWKDKYIDLLEQYSNLLSKQIEKTIN